jgi:hypothetical protein
MSLYLWSIRFTEEDYYKLWREVNLEILPTFDDKHNYIPILIKFWWRAKVCRIYLSY